MNVAIKRFDKIILKYKYYLLTYYHQTFCIKITVVFWIHVVVVWNIVCSNYNTTKQNIIIISMLKNMEIKRFDKIKPQDRYNSL